MNEKEALDRLDDFLEETQPAFISRLRKHDEQRKQLIAEHGDDYDRTVSKFEVNKTEQALINKWLEELKPEIMAIQGKAYGHEPEYGTIGGSLTYSFFGTGLGSILTVKETITGKELNVTKALDWFFFG